MNLRLNVASLLSWILLISLLSSCKTASELIKVTPTSLESAIQGIHDQQIDYTFFYGKARIKYNGEESSMGGRSTIMMIPDSLIWMNMKKISIEGVRSLIKQDSCWILYRQDNLVEAGATKDFLDFYKIYLSFSQLQDALVGNMPVPVNSEVTSFTSQDYHQLSFSREGDRYEYMLNEDFTIYRTLIRDIFGREIMITLTDYDENKFATRKEIEVLIPNRGTSKITMKFSSVAFNTPKTIKFEIPAHYTWLP